MRTFRRILIIQTAFLGDVVLTLPLVEAVHSLWPEAKLGFLVRSSYADFLDSHPLLDEVVRDDKRNRDKRLSGLFRLAAELRSKRYDLALIPHRSFRSGLFAVLSRIPVRVGFRRVAGSIWYTASVNRPLEAHEGARNLALLDAVAPESGVKFGVRPRYPITPDGGGNEVDSWATAVGLQADGRWIVLAPGSVWATKRWPQAHWVELARELESDDANLILIGGPEDEDLCARIREDSGGTAYLAAGRLSVAGSAALISRAKLLITGDTAPLHLAQAADTPTLAIFGPTVPGFGFAPTGENDRIIGLDLPCRPCAIHGGRECPLGHHRCMRWLAPERVVRLAREMLNTPD